MIHKLRKKFIVINMLLIGAVLLILFVVIGVFNYNQLVIETRDALQMTLDMRKGFHNKFEIGSGPMRERPVTTPVFYVILNGDGSYSYFTPHENISISTDTLESAIAAVKQSTENEGRLKEYRLRYMVRHTPEGEKIAFADTSAESNAMRNYILISIFVGIGGLLAFFLISLYLARWALRPVEQTWKQQRQFVADASHELKTPLTVILTNMNILRNHKEDTIKAQEKWVINTQTEADRMKGLVEDMLFLAKYDDPDIPRALASVNLSDLVWNTVLAFEPVAYEKGISIATALQDNLSLYGSERELRQLVGILLDNSCKYAEKGSTITVSLSKEQERIKLTVHNWGNPIPPEDIVHIFERFYRVDKSRKRQGGYGLGLAIAKRITALHQGKISVESTKEKGTIFQAKF